MTCSKSGKVEIRMKKNDFDRTENIKWIDLAWFQWNETLKKNTKQFKTTDNMYDSMKRILAAK